MKLKEDSMKKLTIIAFVISIIFGITSCSKKSDVTPSIQPNTMEITLNGKTYDSNNGGIISYSNQYCQGKVGLLMGVGTVETSELYFELYLMNYQNQVDFEPSNTGDYNVRSFDIFNNGTTTANNFDIEVSYDDKTQNSQSTTLMAGGKNTVLKIEKTSEASSQVDYSVQGEFSCSFKNANDDIINVTGKYNVITYALK